MTSEETIEIAVSAAPLPFGLAQVDAMESKSVAEEELGEVDLVGRLSDADVISRFKLPDHVDKRILEDTYHVIAGLYNHNASMILYDTRGAIERYFSGPSPVKLKSNSSHSTGNSRDFAEMVDLGLSIVDFVADHHSHIPIIDIMVFMTRLGRHPNLMESGDYNSLVVNMTEYLSGVRCVEFSDGAFNRVLDKCGYHYGIVKNYMLD